ncbi:hypothetical protein AK812_SmicGene41268 [Symbiodinium microadriaticum]|uniref:Uncharacterized protein n=1 Tax=Symbiodinium microadriaticum TaxID=2951 RepID=A0A1Q9C6K1_SYMMI|nr:hypothetical protein AK812_SmicGene41268 [Symbiodinium microadriaticum]CAE7259751.1 unnamed protein product [Symbiodinium microadriaticum]
MACAWVDEDSASGRRCDKVEMERVRCALTGVGCSQLRLCGGKLLFELQDPLVGLWVCGGCVLRKCLMDEAAHVFIKFIGKGRQCLLLGWVGDGWDGCLAVCQRYCVEIDLVVIESGKELRGEHCVGYVFGEH